MFRGLQSRQQLVEQRAWQRSSSRGYPDKPEITVTGLVVEPIPFEEASFDFVTAHDFLVPRVVYMRQQRFPFVELMQDIWRVLEERRRFFSYTQAFPHAAMLRDPTRWLALDQAIARRTVYMPACLPIHRRRPGCCSS